MKNHDKYPFTPNALMNPFVWSLFAQIRGLWPEGTERDLVLLDDAGQWLSRTGYADYSGYYISIRLTPIWADLPAAKILLEKIKQGFKEVFPGKSSWVELVGEGVVVYVEDSVCNIGD